MNISSRGRVENMLLQAMLWCEFGLNVLTNNFSEHLLNFLIRKNILKIIIFLDWPRQQVIFNDIENNEVIFSRFFNF